MKKEAEKKSKKWLWLVIGLVLLLAVVGVVLAFVLGGGNNADDDPVGGRPDLYWNVDKATYTQDTDTGMSTRSAAEDGYFYIRFAYNGEIVEYPVADKKLVNYIDTMDVMGLVLDADGVIVDAVLATEIAVEVGYKIYVQKVTEDTVYANSSIAMNGMKVEIALSDLTQIYNVSPSAETAGELLEASQLKVMDTIHIYGNELGENTHIYLVNSPVESPVYWRVTQMYNSTEKITTREPDENGAYSIEFYCNGEIVTLKCKDQALVTTIDSTTRYSPCFGFVFDEDGYIVEKIDSGLGIRAVQRSARFDVMSIGSDGLVETTKIIGSNAGSTDSFYVTEDTIIYDVSKAAVAEGRDGKQVDSLVVGDRIVAWVDADGNAVLVYISNRVVEEATICFGTDRKYDSTTKTTKREPDANGWYYVEVLMNGELITVKTQDKALMSTLDSYSARVYGLTLKEGTNEIEYVYDSECVFGCTPFGQGRYVIDVNGIIVSVHKASTPDTPINGVMSMDCQIVNVSEWGTYGQTTTLQAGDYVYLYQKPAGEIIFGYVIRRMVDTDVYYNLERKYDSEKLVTTREPVEGWYVYTMAVNGKQVEVKTQSEKMATYLDSVSPGILALIVDKNGVVQDAYPGNYATGGYKRASGYTIQSFNDDGTITCVSASGTEYILTLAEDCEIYNVSQVYSSHRGEKGTLKVGDTITALTNTHEKGAVVFIRSREVDYMYINKTPMYNSTNAVSTRVPDANGWYWYELAVNGQLKKFRTNNVELANKIDYYGGGFGLVVDGDVIKSVTSPSYVKGIKSSGITSWDVTAINGNKITVTYNAQGSTNTGKTQTITLASDVKIYDASPTTNNYGAAVKLKVGDRIRTYINEDDETAIVYVLYHDTRAEGARSYCEHCDKVVYWNPWKGGSFPSAGGHYYLVTDVTTTAACSVGRSSTKPASDVVLDLNGNTYCRTNSRAMNIYTNASLSVFDTVGGGAISAVGLENGYGGVILMSPGAKLNLYSGTLTPAENQAQNPRGGVVYMTGDESVFNMYGGTITGGITAPCDEYPYSQGGNVFVNSGTFNMYGGTISGGQCNDGEVEKVDEKGNPYTSTIRGFGGNIYSRLVDTAKVNIYGGTIENGTAYGGGNISGAGEWKITGGTVSGGYAAYRGGSFYINDGFWNISGVTISGGVSENRGGNIYVTSPETKAGEVPTPSVLTVSGGTITGGKAGTDGDNIAVVSGSILNITGGTVSGGSNYLGTGTHTITGGKLDGLTEYKSGELTVSGKPVFTNLAVSKKMTVGELTKDAKIAVDASGIFTNELTNAESYIQYFTAVAQGGEIVAEENALAVKMFDPNSYTAYCEHCKQDNVKWSEWSYLSGSGHYYLAEDLSVTKAIAIASGEDIILDLAGKTVTATDVRAFNVAGQLSILDSSVGGGKITGNGAYSDSNINGGIVQVSGSDAVFNLYSGTVELAAEHNTIYRGGVIYITGASTVNIYGGTITGGASSERGGNITVVSNSSLNIYGGEIIGGSPESIYIGSGVHTISGGTIIGEVTYHSGAALTLSGAPEINYLNIDEGITLDVGELTESASITVSATGTFTTAGAEAYKDFFVTNQEGYEISVAGGALAVTAEVVADPDAYEAECPHCDGAKATWSKWTGVAAAGHYYLAEDAAITDAEVKVTSGTDMVIDLAGKTITATDVRAFNVSGQLSIMDSATGGTIIGNGAYSTGNVDGGVIYVTGSDAVWNLYSGTVKMAAEYNSIRRGGVVYVTGASTANIMGGVIADGVSRERGGNITVVSSSYLNISGGEITGGSPYSLYLGSGTHTISGGTITGDVQCAGGALTLSGTANISNLVTGEYLVALGTLSQDAKIYVTADGAFTDVLTDPQSYLPYFEAVAEGYEIGVSNGALAVVEKTTGGDSGEDDTTKELCPCGCGVALDEIVWTDISLEDGITDDYYINDDGHYRVANNVRGCSGNLFRIKAAKVVIDLNGKTLSNKGRGFYHAESNAIGGSLYILDSVGGASFTTIDYDAENPNNGALTGCWIATRGNTYIYGGNFSSTTTVAGTSTNTTRMIFVREGTLNIYGGTFDATGVVAGHGIMGTYRDTANTINIYGGTFIGGNGNGVGDVWTVNAASTMNIYGGSFQGKVYAKADTSVINLSGAPVMTDLDLTSGAKVTLGELTEGASIAVTAGDEAFSVANEKAEAYASYFSATTEGKTVQANTDNQLVIVDAVAAASEPESVSVFTAVVRSIASFFGLRV